MGQTKDKLIQALVKLIGVAVQARADDSLLYVLVSGEQI